MSLSPVPPGIKITKCPPGPENAHFQWHQFDTELGEYGEHLKQEEMADKAPEWALMYASIGVAIEEAAIYLVDDLEDIV